MLRIAKEVLCAAVEQGHSALGIHYENADIHGAIQDGLETVTDRFERALLCQFRADVTALAQVPQELSVAIADFRHAEAQLEASPAAVPGLEKATNRSCAPALPATANSNSAADSCVFLIMCSSLGS